MIENDKNLLGISFIDEENSKLSKYKSKKIVKKVTLEHFQDLMSKKDLHYEELIIQKYMKSDCILSDNQKRLVLKCHLGN